MEARTIDGMQDVVAAESAITLVDGSAGTLQYRGYPIGELAEQCSFEQVAHLLWTGEVPAAGELNELSSQMRTLRTARGDVNRLVSSAPVSAHPLDVLRFVLSEDALHNPLGWKGDAVSNRHLAVEFTAWFPVVVTAFHRRRQGGQPVHPDPDLDTAANFLYMLRGIAAPKTDVRTLDMSLVLHADHEFNASTFAARVTIATQSNLHAAIASALGTLAGPRHGGASDRVIHMLEDIGDPESVDAYVEEELRNKRRIMGFGHRVYRTVDPRARQLRGMAERLLAGTANERWVDTLGRLEAVMAREKQLYPNVDLYAAVVNHALGVEPAFYTSVFAMSRVVGWTAHALEQLSGRMIRPVAAYTGPDARSLKAPVRA